MMEDKLLVNLTTSLFSGEIQRLDKTEQAKIKEKSRMHIFNEPVVRDALKKLSEE